jgi:hypothetical protein
MIVATPAMQRRAIPTQKEAPWEFVELLAAAARVDDGVAWLEADAGKMVDVGVVVVTTFPDEVGESGDVDKSVLSGVEVVYDSHKYASAHKIMVGLTEMGADICSTIRPYGMRRWDMVGGLPAQMMTQRVELTPVLLRWPPVGKPRV